MPKTWLSLLFGYDGKYFYGMQYQKDPNIKSVQSQLIIKLYEYGFLETNDYLILGKTYKWGRAARTDKGVHAIMNSVSCLFVIPQKFYDQSKTLKKRQLLMTLREIMQSSNILVHGIKRVVTRFDVRQMVKYRTYKYVCPKNYFAKGEDNDKILEKINKCCQKFKGTHNFHNYSKNIKAKDPTAQRYILDFNCVDFHKENSNQIEWVMFTIKGQSFIYHQIRKIIGCIVYVILNEYDPDFIDNTFFKNQIPLPLAPPFGLYLSRLWFDSYNKKKQIPQKIQLEPAEEQSVSNLQTIIQNQITKIPDDQWKRWVSEIKQGIDEMNFLDDLDNQIPDNIDDN